jgi:hypothetical protein
MTTRVRAMAGFSPTRNQFSCAREFGSHGLRYHSPKV